MLRTFSRLQTRYGVAPACLLFRTRHVLFILSCCLVLQNDDGELDGGEFYEWARKSLSLGALMSQFDQVPAITIMHSSATLSSTSAVATGASTHRRKQRWPKQLQQKRQLKSWKSTATHTAPLAPLTALTAPLPQNQVLACATH